MSETFHVRLAEPNDVYEVVAMQRELAAYCGCGPEDFGITEERALAIMQQDEQAAYYVAHNDAERVGMMLCHRVPLGWRGVSGVYVEDLFVKPAYRHGLGIGRLLIGQACRIALEYANGDERAAFIRLDTGIADNDDTLRFYRKLGMSEDNINFRLYGNALRELTDVEVTE